MILITPYLFHAIISAFGSPLLIPETKLAWSHLSRKTDHSSEKHLRTCQTYMMDGFPKIIHSFSPLNIFAKGSNIDV